MASLHEHARRCPMQRPRLRCQYGGNPIREQTERVAHRGNLVGGAIGGHFDADLF
jgi:hypothetical protein